jgi:diguanylate cyclase (GGDEF)-like protein
MLAGTPTLATARPQLKEWLARHAARIAAVREAHQARQKLAESNRRLRIAMRSVEELQRPASPEALEERVLEALRAASEATFGVLVRWDHETHEGTVRAVVGPYPAPAPQVGDAVESGDVWEVCQSDEPRAWESAAAIAGRHGWLSQSSKVPLATSLAIIPMARESRRLGAVVLGSTGDRVLRMADLRPARQVAALAAAALDAAWLLADASTRSRTDALTGLWNRRHFDEQIARVRNETDRFGGESALLILDVDHFKKVNDTHGHEAGDAVLRMVASVLPRLVRTTDVAARIGGEEMCVLLPQTGAEGARELAERLRVSIGESRLPWQGKALQVTASFGVSVYRAGSKVNAWFDQADRALYRAKSGGRNRVEIATPEAP